MTGEGASKCFPFLDMRGHKLSKRKVVEGQCCELCDNRLFGELAFSG